MKRILLASVMAFLITPVLALSQYEGETNRGGSWKKQGNSLIFVGDRLDGTVLNSNMTVRVKLDGKLITGCRAAQSRSNPKGIRLMCKGSAPNSNLNEPDGLGVMTR